ncbi:hypothetical protein HDE_07909 [Halotydeus destructor]|nr:hypothetical protein HDE_07909 [Halotydeus destructor]
MPMDSNPPPSGSWPLARLPKAIGTTGNANGLPPGLLCAKVSLGTFPAGHQGCNGAALYMTKAVKGSQDVELHFNILDSDHQSPYCGI